MDNNFDHVNVDFGKLVERYLAHYTIDRRLLAKFLVVSSNDIKNIIAGRKGVVLKTAEKTASFFGLKYFQMANPDFIMPKKSNLPTATQKLLDANPLKTYGDHDLNQALDDIFKNNFLEAPRTSREIADKLPNSIPVKVRTPSRVSDAISKGTWEDLVAELPKVKGKKYYQLVKFIEKGDQN